MPTELVEILDNFHLGTALQIIVACTTCLSGAYFFFKREIKKIRESASQETMEELEEEKEEKKIDNIEKGLNDLNDYVSKRFQRCKDLADMEETIRTYKKDLEEINEQVIILEKNVQILLRSCITLNRVIITMQRNKIVNDKIVDISSLRDVEEMYANYLDEVKDGGDEFIARLLREIRDTPVKSD